MVVELTDDEAAEVADLLESMDDALLAEYGGPGSTGDPDVREYVKLLRRESGE